MCRIATGREQRIAELENKVAAVESRYAELEKKSGSELNRLSSDLGSKESMLKEREARLRHLETMLRRQDSLLSRLNNSVKNALLGFSPDELTVEMKNGKVYVSMSDKLLFKSGRRSVSAILTWRRMGAVLTDRGWWVSHPPT